MAAKGFVGSDKACSSMSVGKSLRPKSGDGRWILLAVILDVGATSVYDDRGLPYRALMARRRLGIQSVVELLKLLMPRRGLGDVSYFAIGSKHLPVLRY